MLLSFRFSNHRSFRDEQQLNLTPVYGSDEPNPSERAVTVAGVFGANASGKSNLMSALTFMHLYAIRSDREVEPELYPGTDLVREPFRLDVAARSELSRYAVDLSLNDERHTYGFALGPDGIAEEWLYHYPHKRKRVVFERSASSFDWGEQTRRRRDLESIAAITAPSALFLSTAVRFRLRVAAMDAESVDPLIEVYWWFFKMRRKRQLGPRIRTGTWWIENESDRAVVVGLLQAADVGIIDVSAVEDPHDPVTLLDRLSGQLIRGTQLMFTHRGATGDAEFELKDESTGTQQLLDLAIDVAIVLEHGGTMTVDEIDASLHPMLTAKLIGLFQNDRTNTKGAQLIFTSHDASLLGNFDGEEVLHRDQIWFTEKDQNGASSLYPLSDFKPRKDGENRQRRYLNGSYGAVPDLNDDLFVQALDLRGEFGAATAE